MCVILLTGPPSPQNITVGPITTCQLTVHWMLPDEQLKAGWTFVVRYMDMSTSEERIVGMTDISNISDTVGMQSYNTVIGKLESYRKYRFVVCTVTQHGIESCDGEPVTIQTGEHTTGLLHCKHFDLLVTTGDDRLIDFRH